MNRTFRRGTRMLSGLSIVALVGLGSVAVLPVAAVAAPAAPAELELKAGADPSITLSWAATQGAASYRIYRGTTSGGESGSPIATVTGVGYTDVNLSRTPIYY
jgi:fibronectin type 3 domain-containing protein